MSGSCQGPVCKAGTEAWRLRSPLSLNPPFKPIEEEGEAVPQTGAWGKRRKYGLWWVQMRPRMWPSGKTFKTGFFTLEESPSKLSVSLFNLVSLNKQQMCFHHVVCKQRRMEWGAAWAKAPKWNFSGQLQSWSLSSAVCTPSLPWTAFLKARSFIPRGKMYFIWNYNVPHEKKKLLYTRQTWLWLDSTSLKWKCPPNMDS